LRYIKEKEKFHSCFGLFLNPHLNLIRKKLKTNFLNQFQHENLISLLEGDNAEAYYINTNPTLQLLGVELRFIEPLSS